MCLRMVQTISQKEVNDLSAIDMQNARNDRESTTNAGTRSATDAKFDCGAIDQ